MLLVGTYQLTRWQMQNLILLAPLLLEYEGPTSTSYLLFWKQFLSPLCLNHFQLQECDKKLYSNVPFAWTSAKIALVMSSQVSLFKLHEKNLKDSIKLQHKNLPSPTLLSVFESNYSEYGPWPVYTAICGSRALLSEPDSPVSSAIYIAERR